MGPIRTAAALFLVTTATWGDDLHWSFEPVADPRPPTVRGVSWAESPIDRFVLARLEAAGLAPGPDADRSALLRRLYFDLTGLPPTIAEWEAFSADERPDAVGRVVDRLLASPAFGERWGRHWLDLARYAESNGGDRNVVHQHAWRYRDWVVDAVNADQPFDEFVRDQVAGDLRPSDDRRVRDGRLVATGFLTLGPKRFMETKAERFELDVVDEQLDVLGRAVLGLSFGCARCHDHFFDPITQHDYYGLAGVFVSTDLLYGPAAPAGNQYGHDRPLQPIGENAAALHGPALAWQADVAERTSVRNKARSDRYREVRRKQALENELKKLESDEANAERVAEIRTELEKLEKSIAEWDAKIEALDAELEKVRENPPPFPDYAMAVREAEQVEDCRIRNVGVAEDRGEVVSRGLPGLPGFDEGGPIDPGESGRRQLAEWIVAPGNPLAARVAVNRIWQHLLGEGLVRSVDDFGLNGEEPSHPELLDHLATRFVESGWSTKAVVREIVTSHVYRLSSRAEGPGRDVDPENRLLWRASYRRLEAEPLRDAMLAVSGELNRQPRRSSVVAGIVDREFNARVQLTPEQLSSDHRTVYLPIVRQSLPQWMTAFDFPDPSLLRGRRLERTNVEQQLFLMNSAFVRERSVAASRRLLSEESDEEERIRRAHLRFLGREPTPDESRRTRTYLRAERATDDDVDELEALTRVCHALFASAAFRHLP